MKIANWNIEEMTGYKPLTTSYMDFSIAEPFGLKAIKDTYKDLFRNFKGNYKYLTELTMALNWKIWQWYETNETIARLYNELWKEMDKYCMNNFKGEELKYYFITTD